MELPHLGANCALRECNRLDFLPVKCDSCSQTFCIEHYKYESHNCQLAKNKDNQVPVCPLCSKPVVGRRNELPDVAVSQHIDKYCEQNDLLKRREKERSSLQACTFKSCKQKDLIYLECRDCRAKFCIKHRHPADHSCPGPSIANNLAENWHSFKGSCSTSASSGYSMLVNRAQQISKSGQAALNRLASRKGNSSGGASHAAGNGTNNSHRAFVGHLQGNISEQEALAIALRESASPNQQVGGQASPQEQEDLALARAIHESQLNHSTGGRAGGSGSKDNCAVS